MRVGIGVALAMIALAARANAGTVFGALSNFDAVNDTGSPCNGFEIELDEIQARDVTYTFEFQRYGVPKITEDTVSVNGVPHPRTFVRWMSPYDQVNHVFTQTTPVAPLGFKNTGGHLCYKDMTVNGQPYDTSGCEHLDGRQKTGKKRTRVFQADARRREIRDAPLRVLPVCGTVRHQQLGRPEHGKQ